MSGLGAVRVKIEYSEDEDALYIYLKEVDVSRSRDADEGIIVDYDARGDIVGIEVLDASSRVVASGGVGRLVRRISNQDSER